MSLIQLVDYFNDKFIQEYQLTSLPLTLEKGVVKGMFDTIGFDSEFTPVCHANYTQQILGYAARISINARALRSLKTLKVDELIKKAYQPEDFKSIIHFDRLCRTVHLLNALAIMQPHDWLILEVDPGHLLGLEQQHGAFFEEVLLHCGLKTQNIVVTMTVNGVHQSHHVKLLQGLNNYRQRGYRVALNVGYLFSANRVLDLINNLSPDYVMLEMPNHYYSEKDRETILEPALLPLKTLTQTLGTQTLMQQIKRADQALMTQKLGIDFAEGGYYQNLFQPALSTSASVLQKAKHKIVSGLFILERHLPIKRPIFEES